MMAPRPLSRRADQPGWKQPWHAWWRRWWDARLPRQDHLTLTQKNLYILPSKAGWSFVAVFMVLLLASINEQVNLGYALSFMLSGAGLAALYLTHANLHGVSLRLLPLRSVHAGEVLSAQVVLTNRHQRAGRFGLVITAGPRAPRARSLAQVVQEMSSSVQAARRWWSWMSPCPTEVGMCCHASPLKRATLWACFERGAIGAPTPRS